MSILACGPYIGSFEQEILTFRPYTRWLTEVVYHEKVYVSTHSNRFFLYDFVPGVNLLPVFENLSRDEKNQTGYIHNKIKQSDFGIIVKKFKEDIVEREKCNKRDIDLYHLNYVKSTPPYSIFHKVFEKIDARAETGVGKVVFIPTRTENEQKMRWIYKHLLDNYNVTVIGDENTYFRKDNEVLGRIDYFESGWRSNIQHITEARAVVCPIGYWTTIANLQSVPVFSWGENVSQHREGGIYYFGNERCVTFPTRQDTDVNIIIGMIDYFLRENMK